MNRRLDIPANVRLAQLPGVPAFNPPRGTPTSNETDARDHARRIDREEWGQTVTLLSRGTGAPGLPPEASLFTTEGSWRGVDVYVLPVPPAAGFSSAGCISIFIYAITKGVRTLVASGRYAVPAGAAPLLPPTWVAGARSIVAKYEVTTQWTQSSAAAFVVGQVAVAIVASDECVDLPEELGAELAGGCYLQASVATGLGVNIAGVQIPNHLELVKVRAVNGSAAPRYLQLHDTNLVIPPLGSVPIMEWPLGPGAGYGLEETRVRYRSKNRIQLVQSSTLNSLTVQVDGSISAELR